MKSLIIIMFLGSATLIMGGPLDWFREVREDSGCVDVYPTEKCKEHATNEGYCDDYQDFMEKNCARTCGFCQPQAPVPDCKDDIEGCEEHAAIEHYCEYNSDFMSIYCRKTCKYCRQPAGPTKELFWEILPWGECKQGSKERGVRCIHVFEGKMYQVDLQACRENLINEPEPEDKSVCAK